MLYDKAISLLIFDGNPDGRVMCELSNWNGRLYKVARSDLQWFLKRTDARNTGVYFLFGKNESLEDALYIGEAEEVGRRVKQHLDDAFEWNECIVVISKDDHLNKAHAKFLEYSFYCMARKAARSDVINATVPTCPSMSEYDRAMLREFIDNTRFLVSTLGNKSFDPIVTEEGEDIKGDEGAEVFLITAPRGADAKGILVPEGFAVFKGSRIAGATVPSMPPNLVRLRDRLIQEGVVDDLFRFTKDYLFTSPSLAAAVVLGRSANGRIEWVNQEGLTIKAKESAQQ